MKFFLTLTLMLADSETSVWQELFEYFKNKYFTADYSGIENFTPPESSFFTLPTMIFALFIGALIAAAAAIYNKRYIGDFVRSLIRNECGTPSAAKTLSELGYQKKTAIRSSLHYGSTLRRIVKCSEDDEFESAETAALAAEAVSGEDGKVRGQKKIKLQKHRTDVDAGHFYIPREKMDGVDIRYRKKGTDWLIFALFAVAGFVLAILMIQVVPDLMRMLDNFITLVKS